MRCSWVNLENKKYVDYHDIEWARPSHNDKYLYEMLILESFQAGLSWEIVLNKRENFREAFSNFEIDEVIKFDEDKIEELLQNPGIIRHRLKIKSAINNSKIFKVIQSEFGSFSNYIWSFTDGEIIYENDKTTSQLSDKISKDLKKRGMKFVGSTIIYSYLQAIGVINSHEEDCFLYNKLVKK
ncbi:DNA-3-methyladenine glycosylase I [Peptoniphilus sp. MSJ-1]|uniref:DNA-3-methyladenine glycosylase I n=1 Tax=Peptoniphilus ovalis TaxID=2841503 RepID=A0ABS6FFE6_9FIRM|nr:DNA-3-methyladenine glycosylase I [Peptoniphilus ovalis]MBU5668918.1 DNA-3-methyladenine glycosylase I [Peptoniphilus ovalis]